MISKRVTAVILLFLIFGISLAIAVGSQLSGSEFPKYNRFYYMEEYMSDIEDFVQENFPFAERLKNSSVQLQLLLGKKEHDDLFIGNDILIEDIEQPDANIMERNLQELQAFVEMETYTPISVLYLPTKYAIKQQELPDNAEYFAFNQKNFIDKSYAALSGKATTVDAYSTLFANNDKYLYYRTDPNLTGLGAYYVYSALIQRMGMSPLEQDEFDQQHISHNYYGSTFAASSYKDISPDIITLYHPTNQSSVAVTHHNDYSYTYNELYPKHLMELSGDLSVILGGDSGDITIRSGLKRQRKLLVFGDESILPILPLLSAHYYEIRFIDFEHWNDTVLNELDVEEMDQILLAYSVDSLIHDPYPAQIRQVRQWQESLMQE
ncbi:MAG: hypothetical protein E7475_06035 [Ruminococcaceae bacterium]|nr:hypothetical protein [Oscillospiraceae bacterium]